MCCVFLVLQCNYLFRGFELFQNGNVMIPDRSQSFLDDFWNDRTCDQIWTLGPRIYHKNTLKHTEIHGNLIKHYYFSMSENLIF